MQLVEGYAAQHLLCVCLVNCYHLIMLRALCVRRGSYLTHCSCRARCWTSACVLGACGEAADCRASSRSLLLLWLMIALSRSRAPRRYKSILLSAGGHCISSKCQHGRPRSLRLATRQGMTQVFFIFVSCKEATFGNYLFLLKEFLINNYIKK